MREKVDPYLRPIYDALHDLLPEGRLERAIETGQIEIAPLAFMRGRTLRNAAVILDEAQNATPMQMKMFLTRLGENSRMVVTGDPNQSDLPAGLKSGLQDAVDRLVGIEGIAIVRFDQTDIVRHPLVQKIVRAYEADEAPAADVGRRGTDARSRADPSGSGTMNDDSSHPIEVAVEAEAWQTTVTDPIGLIRSTAAHALAEAAPPHLREAHVSVLLTDDARIRVLNREWRGKDKPTDVLSFPAYDPDVPLPPGMTPELGDIVVALETVARDALADGRTVDQHLRHMIVHGVLHLLGMDHETGEADALEMEGMEARILAGFGVADPYGEAVR